MGAGYATGGGSGKRWRGAARRGVAGALLVVCEAAIATGQPRSFGDGLCAVRTARCGAPPRFAVLAAFPGELRPLLARARVHETLVAGDRVLRVGTLAGVPVVLGLLGIGLANAEATTRLVLDRFDVAGVVVSGVAGSTARIGDVTVPARWTFADGATYDVDPALLRRATRAAPRAELDRCTSVPPEPPGPTVCLAHQPLVLVGGVGRSDDPYGGRPLPCVPGGDDVFGCDVGGTAQGVGEPVAVDMETAAAAREARVRGIPFIAFRAVSDGAGDPLGLPGFPQQFFAWYGLAARNAAAAVAAFLERAGHTSIARDPGAGGTPRARASCDWERRATAVCAGGQAPRALRARVDRACRLLAGDGADPSVVQDAWLGAVTLASRPAIRQRAGTRCARALEGALRTRALGEGQPEP